MTLNGKSQMTDGAANTQDGQKATLELSFGVVEKLANLMITGLGAFGAVLAAGAVVATVIVLFKPQPSPWMLALTLPLLAAGVLLALIARARTYKVMSRAKGDTVAADIIKVAAKRGTEVADTTWGPPAIARGTKQSYGQYQEALAQAVKSGRAYRLITSCSAYHDREQCKKECDRLKDLVEQGLQWRRLKGGPYPTMPDMTMNDDSVLLAFSDVPGADSLLLRGRGISAVFRRYFDRAWEEAQPWQNASTPDDCPNSLKQDPE